MPAVLAKAARTARSAGVRRSALRAFGYAFAISWALASVGCKPKASPPAPRPSASPAAPSADPARFTAQISAFSERFRGVASTLPNCAPLLENAAERESCARTRAAVTALEAALARGASHGELIGLAGAAALSAQRSAQLLRRSGVARLVQDAKSLPSASAAPHDSARPPLVPPTPSAVKSLPSAMVRSQRNADLDAITAHARIVTLALRELATYLEFGPPELRVSALSEIERLAREEPHWAALRAIIDEAFLVERDPALKTRLSRLREQLG